MLTNTNTDIIIEKYNYIQDALKITLLPIKHLLFILLYIALSFFSKRFASFSIFLNIIFSHLLYVFPIIVCIFKMSLCLCSIYFWLPYFGVHLYINSLFCWWFVLIRWCVKLCILEWACVIWANVCAGAISLCVSTYDQNIQTSVSIHANAKRNKTNAHSFDKLASVN